MIKFNKQESINCKIHENIQKIEIYDLTSKNNRKIVANKLKKENIRLMNILVNLKERG